MGCDIHGWIEGYNMYLNRWDSLIQIDKIVSRNYKLFCSLAHVRCGLDKKKILKHKK